MQSASLTVLHGFRMLAMLKGTDQLLSRQGTKQQETQLRDLRREPPVQDHNPKFHPGNRARNSGK